MKIAIITDTHWGARNDSLQLIEYYKKFYSNVFIPKLIEEKIDTVVMLGDTFDRRKYTNHVTLYHAKKIFFGPLQELGIKITMLVGNHDTAYKNTNEINSPELFLKEYSNIEIIVNPLTMQFGNSSVCMIPWICPENYVDSMNEINNTEAKILMGHLEVSGFAMYRGVESHDGMSQDIFSKFDKVFTGHYHHKSSKGNIHYLGNPYELTWQDYQDPRGFHLFDLETQQLEFVQNPYTMFERIEYDDSKVDPDKIDASVVADKYVKIVVTSKTNLYKFDQFINRVYNSNPIEVRILEDFSEFTAGAVDDTIDLEDTSSVVTNYVDSLSTDVDKEKIKSFMKTLMTEALYQRGE